MKVIIRLEKVVFVGKAVNRNKILSCLKISPYIPNRALRYSDRYVYFQINQSENRATLTFFLKRPSCFKTVVCGCNGTPQSAACQQGYV